MATARNSLLASKPLGSPGSWTCPARRRFGRSSPGPKDKAVTVKVLVEQRFAGPGQDVPIRQTSQGPLRSGIWAVPARVASSAGTTKGQKLLVVRQEADGRTTRHRNR